jgi:hypothetical protein
MIVNTYNKYCSNIIIAVYPRFAGGKFLLNCLGLSNDCYLQDSKLVSAQIDKKLSPEDKFTFLIEKLDKTTVWNDLDIGCIELFNYPFDPLKFSTVISQISYEKKYFFVIAHDYGRYTRLKQIWPDAKVLYFNCTNEFINWRLGLDQSVDRTHYLEVSQDFPVNYQNLFNLTDDTIFWNANWFLNEEIFLIEIKKVYDTLQLTDFNIEFIKSFRSKYLDTLLKIRQS